MGPALSKVKRRSSEEQESSQERQLPKPIFQPTDNKVITLYGREFNSTVQNTYLLPRDRPEVDRLNTVSLYTVFPLVNKQNTKITL